MATCSQGWKSSNSRDFTKPESTNIGLYHGLGSLGCLILLIFHASLWHGRDLTCFDLTCEASFGPPFQVRNNCKPLRLLPGHSNGSPPTFKIKSLHFGDLHFFFSMLMYCIWCTVHSLNGVRSLSDLWHHWRPSRCVTPRLEHPSTGQRDGWTCVDAGAFQPGAFQHGLGAGVFVRRTLVRFFSFTNLTCTTGLGFEGWTRREDSGRAWNVLTLSESTHMTAWLERVLDSGRSELSGIEKEVLRADGPQLLTRLCPSVAPFVFEHQAPFVFGNGTFNGTLEWNVTEAPCDQHVLVLTDWMLWLKKLI